MCNKLTIEVLEICIQHLSHLSAAHIPGKHNVIANLASRKFQDSAEWMISTDIFNKLCYIFGIPHVYLFASRLKKQLEHYASWLPDSGSCIIDATSVLWHSQYVYIFPPFSMIWPASKKVRGESQKALIVVPKWTTQLWFPFPLQLAVAQPREISSRLLTLLGTKKTHTLNPKLRLLAVLCSNYIKEQKIFQIELPIYYQQHGRKKPKVIMKVKSKGTSVFVTNGRLIHTTQMIP